MDLDFNFSVSSLIAGFVFGVLGMWLIKRAKREGHLPSLGVGITLIIFPYFVENPYLVWVVGVGLLVVAVKMD